MTEASISHLCIQSQLLKDHQAVKENCKRAAFHHFSSNRAHSVGRVSRQLKIQFQRHSSKVRAVGTKVAGVAAATPILWRFTYVCHTNIWDRFERFTIDCHTNISDLLTALDLENTKMYEMLIKTCVLLNKKSPLHSYNSKQKNEKYCVALITQGFKVFLLICIESFCKTNLLSIQK